MPVLVVGLGHPDRGDDAVGWLVAAEVARRRPDVPTRTMPDPAALLDVLATHAHVLVVDAALAAAPSPTVGAVHVHDATRRALPASTGGVTSSHGLTLGHVIELGRAAGGAPSGVAVVTVSGSRFGLGEPVQEAVRRAVGPAADRVLDVLDDWAATSRSSGPGRQPQPGSRPPSR